MSGVKPSIGKKPGSAMGKTPPSPTGKLVPMVIDEIDEPPESVWKHGGKTIATDTNDVRCDPFVPEPAAGAAKATPASAVAAGAASGSKNGRIPLTSEQATLLALVDPSEMLWFFFKDISVMLFGEKGTLRDSFYRMFEISSSEQAVYETFSFMDIMEKIMRTKKKDASNEYIEEQWDTYATKYKSLRVAQSNSGTSQYMIWKYGLLPLLVRELLLKQYYTRKQSVVNGIKDVLDEINANIGPTSTGDIFGMMDVLQLSALYTPSLIFVDLGAYDAIFGGKSIDGKTPSGCVFYNFVIYLAYSFINYSMSMKYQAASTKDQRDSLILDCAFFNTVLVDGIVSSNGKGVAAQELATKAYFSNKSKPDHATIGTSIECCHPSTSSIPFGFGYINNALDVFIYKDGMNGLSVFCTSFSAGISDVTQNQAEKSKIQLVITSSSDRLNQFFTEMFLSNPIFCFDMLVGFLAVPAPSSSSASQKFIAKNWHNLISYFRETLQTDFERVIMFHLFLISNYKKIIMKVEKKKKGKGAKVEQASVKELLTGRSFFVNQLP